MKINQTYLKSIFLLPSKLPNKITRIALNALVIANCCALSCMFFVSSTVLLATASTITIIGSAVLIEKVYH